MREVLRHKSVQVLSDYVRNSDLLKDYAGKNFLKPGRGATQRCLRALISTSGSGTTWTPG